MIYFQMNTSWLVSTVFYELENHQAQLNIGINI